MNLPNVRKTILIFTIAAGLLSILMAGDFWEKKPFTEWTEKETLSILVDSPWSQDQVFRALKTSAGVLAPTPTQVPREGSGGYPDSNPSAGPGQTPGGFPDADSARISRQYTIAFVSSLPMRQARARWAMLKGGASEEQAQRFLKQTVSTDRIVVAVAVHPKQPHEELAMTLEDLGEDTYLLLKDSQRKIHVQDYQAPEAGGGEALFYFPRGKNGQNWVNLDEKEITFHSRLSDDTKLEQKFKLKKMVVNGELQI